MAISLGIYPIFRQTHMVTCPATKSTGALTAVADLFFSWIVPGVLGLAASIWEALGAMGPWGHGPMGQPPFVAACQNVTHFGRCPGAGLGGASVINIAMRNLLLRTAASIVTHSVSHDDVGVTRPVRAKGSTSAKWGGTIYPWHHTHLN